MHEQDRSLAALTFQLLHLHHIGPILQTDRRDRTFLLRSGEGRYKERPGYHKMHAEFRYLVQEIQNYGLKNYGTLTMMHIPL